MGPAEGPTPNSGPWRVWTDQGTCGEEVRERWGMDSRNPEKWVLAGARGIFLTETQVASVAFKHWRYFT